MYIDVPTLRPGTRIQRSNRHFVVTYMGRHQVASYPTEYVIAWYNTGYFFNVSTSLESMMKYRYADTPRATCTVSTYLQLLKKLSTMGIHICRA